MQLIEASGNTGRSLDVWETTRPIFGVFQEAIFGTGDRHYAKTGPGFERDPSDPRAWLTASMVLRDEIGNELWLSGCGSGYRGTGPTAAAYILYRERFPAKHVQLVLTREPLHVVRGQSAPLVAEWAPGREDSPEDFKIIETLQTAEANGYFRALRNASRPDSSDAIPDGV